jgi:hypothetical protein
MSAEEITAMHGHMESFHKRLAESGELVDAQDLATPVRACPILCVSSSG